MRNRIQNFYRFSFLLAFLVFFSCKQTRIAKEMPTSLSAFIYAYTSGEISKAAPIKVRFTSSLIDAEKIGSALDEDIISFRPRIKGKAIWEDDRTIQFTPDDYLEADKDFIGKVNLKKLYKTLPEDATTFEFDFKVKAQNFSVNFQGLTGIDPSDTKNQRLTGSVFTYDLAESAEVEKLLEVQLSNQTPSIRWEHGSDKKVHSFFIENIARGKEDEELVVKWNGSPLGVDVAKSQSFTVPGIGNFKVMSALVVQDEEQYALIHFSDPLLQSQDFQGLVRIKDYSGVLRFQVDGNQLRIYPAARLSGEKTITIESALKNINKDQLKKQIQETLLFEAPKPALRLVGSGVILPNSEGLIFPFEAVNLNVIDVEIFKIYNNNILQFLQTNEIDGGDYQLNRVGKIEVQKQIKLNDLNEMGNNSTWTRYALDLSTILQQDPNAIYQIRIGFRPGYTSYYCGSDNKGDDLQILENPFDNPEEAGISIMDYGYYGIGGYYDGFEYEHRDNPCFPAYFGSHNFVSRNVVASNLGIIAKSGTDGNMKFYVTDLRTTESVSGIKLEIFDYQQQLITTVQTDGDGIAVAELADEQPFVAVANQGSDKGYLRLMDNNSLSLSKFDVSGTEAQKGIKGFIYGERGVWRPGDSLYLNFVLEDKLGKLPENHPISFELYDARNQLYTKFTTTNNVNKVYPLAIATKPDDATGNWRATVKLGGATFGKTLKIETIKPNRLKINLDFGKKELSAVDMPLNTDLQVNWLHGAPARNLKTKIEMKLRQTNTTFPAFGDFEFDDPARQTSSEFSTLFDREIDNNGNAKVKTDFRGNEQLPGKMKADFRTRAFEKGGDFSEDNQSITYSPFKSYAGVAIPTNRYGSKRVDIEKGGTFEFAAVDEKGEPVKNRKLKIGIYRAEWRWWWESNQSNVSMYNSSSHYNALDAAEVTTNSKGTANWDVKVDGWGYYLVRVCDEESGHCSGDYFYSGYPWYGEDNDQHRKAAAMLMFSTDKKKYEVGDDVEIRIPSSEGGRILVTIESGSKILDSYWKTSEAEETKFTFEATPEMAPTVYAHVSLLQPHSQTENDLPIRMYGVVPINVEDPNTRLKPTIKMADVLKPEEKVKIEVSETSGQAMAYTVAVVDDGLLDLTRFKTPNPWDVFYAREALGVKTWDVYDYVLGASGGMMDKLLSIGGDAENIDKGGADKANRFKPVVKHFGPFYLKKGEKKTHEFIMPNYVGSVRTMVVASNNGAYGNAEKTTPVRKPLMVLATLPRVLGPGERLKLPVNVFAMEDKVKTVNVKVEETTGRVNFLGEKSQTLSFSRVGDQLAEFEIEIPRVIGVARFKVTASGGGEVATQEIEIDIRNPNPYVTDSYAEVLENTANWTKDFELPGIEGTNTATLEVSNIPPLNLDKRINYLIRYPYGCVEQTTSSVFPQLYVGAFLDLDDKRKKEIAFNVKAGIERLKSFQHSSGGFAYWPGNNYVNSWSSSYAGHFLVEAKSLGYDVSSIVMDRWLDYQKKEAKNWNQSTNTNGYYRGNYAFEQAYRLYTLALAGKPELGAMNRLREMKDLSTSTKWRLAATYAIAGKTEVANQLVQNLTTEIEDYVELSYTFGSQTRDEAMIVETMMHLNRMKDAAIMVKQISEDLNSSRWYSTQTTAYSLKVIGKFVSLNKLSDELRYTYQLGNGQEVAVGSQKPISLIDIDVSNGRNTNVTVKNNSGGMLYAKIVVRGQPIVGDQTEASKNMAMEINYKTTDGKTLDPSRIEQGTDFIAEITVKNNDSRKYYHKEMAISQVFPSGWEILNTRMSNVANFENTDVPVYQDIRDDRVYTFYETWYNKSKTFRIQLNAAYIGRFYLPSVTSEAMYDNTVNARKPGQWVEVVGPEEI
jgi:alpha-2-macroglobulin